MLVDAPAAGLVAEVVDDELRCLETAVGLRARDPGAVGAEADDVGAAVAARIGEEARMLVDSPAARVVAEVAHPKLRKPSEVPGGETADGEGVGLHQALHAAFGGAVLAVAVGEAEAPPGAPAAATAGGVFVGAAEDVPGLMREHPVDVVRAPAVVVVIHDEPRPTDARVGEVVERVFGEEGAEGPARPETAADVLDVGAHTVPVGAEADRSHRRIAPESLEIGRVRIGLHGQVDVLDVVGEGDAGQGIGGGEPAEAVLHLGNDLQHFRLGELQRRGRPLNDDDAHGDRSLEVGAGRSACPRADARHGFGRRHDGGTAVLHIPDLAVARPNVLGLSVVG